MHNSEDEDNLYDSISDPLSIDPKYLKSHERYLVPEGYSVQIQTGKEIKGSLRKLKTDLAAENSDLVGILIQL